MDLATARGIMARVFSTGHGDRLDSLLSEREFKGGLGDVVAEREIDRAVDDLVGHWRDGEWVGAATITQARTICRTYSGLYPEVKGT